MDTRINVTLQQDGFFAIPYLKIKKTHVKGLGNVIREGYSLKVTKTIDDNSKIDLTKETLIRIAMFDHPGDHAKKVQAVYTALETCEKLSGSSGLFEECLYLIIENGGLQEYVKRSSKGMVYYGQ